MDEVLEAAIKTALAVAEWEKEMHNLQTARAIEWTVKQFQKAICDGSNRLLDYDEAAEFLGCTRRTLERLKKAKRLVPAEGEDRIRFRFGDLVALKRLGVISDPASEKGTKATARASGPSSRVRVTKVKVIPERNAA